MENTKKICIISYDFWQYDAHIVENLRKKGVDAHHINIGNYTYENLQARVKNTVSKIFFGKNIKHHKRQEFVLDSLKELGHQDQILIINPETLDEKVIEQAKAYCHELIAYLYDSLHRNPAEHLLHYFDKIFSFDDEDVRKYGFEKLTNYNYLPYLPQEQQHPNLDVYYVTSYDKHRISVLKKLAKKIDHFELKFQFVIVGKKSWKHKVKGFVMENFGRFRINRIQHDDLAKLYQNTKVLLDLKREGQSGLSFRIFEAMALEKKIITDNQDIEKCDFFNPNNILILKEDFSNLTKDFFETPYEKLPNQIYQKYTLDAWTETVFQLK